MEAAGAGGVLAEGGVGVCAWAATFASAAANENDTVSAICLMKKIPASPSSYALPPRVQDSERPGWCQAASIAACAARAAEVRGRP
ncbi:Hypothetical protein CAP_0623 [Chondromyces apiculatus DSM 436]|uniref:Uncharacterized protein n=1 Tax=Chondromyces apiculatus DSM 436 TaxID=1192034 RepID=A0A017TD45_9BACT|nr:Hypothetical protein CAP_0623 [Chondromyces apiculatus DSM 436]